MSDYKSRVKQILRQARAAPQKRFGHHFLVSQTALDAVERAIDFDRAPAVLEIGPGLGFLTERIAPRAGRLIAVEKDRKFAGYLQAIYRDRPNTKIVLGDILTFEFRPALGGARAVCAGNIPYNITSPIVDRLLQTRDIWAQVVMTVQKDFADRLTARERSADRSALSCWMQMHARIRILERFGRNMFYPAPKVDSALVEIEFYEKPLYEEADGPEIERCIRCAFQKRRKTIANALENAAIGLPKADVRRLCVQAGVGESARPQDLSLNEWIAIGRTLRDSREASSGRPCI